MGQNSGKPRGKVSLFANFEGQNPFNKAPQAACLARQPRNFAPPTKRSIKLEQGNQTGDSLLMVKGGRN